MVMLPQILLSGMIFPLDAMAAGVRWIGYLLPLTYFNVISRGIMLRGADLSSLWWAFLILTVMALVVFTGATLRFRRDLAPGHPEGAGPGRRKRPLDLRHVLPVAAGDASGTPAPSPSGGSA